MASMRDIKRRRDSIQSTGQITKAMKLVSTVKLQKAKGKAESIRLFDNQDLCMLLQISKRTLQRYRSVGALPYKTLGKKTYYSEEDVLTFLSNHIKDFKKEDIAFYKARIHNFFHK